MKFTRTNGLVKLRRVALLFVALFSLLPAALAQDIHLALLKTKTGTLTNVTVMKKSATDIFVSHSRGLGNIKVESIDDDDAMRALGFKVVQEESVSNTNSTAAVALSTAKEKLKDLPAAAPLLAKLESLSTVQPSQKEMIYAGAILFVVYLFYCFCLNLICLKAGTSPGILVWLPVFQIIPTFQAARMSGWWFLAMFIPLLNIIAWLIWCFKIAHARGKSALVGIALILPVTNVLAFLYLAFSGGGGEVEEERRRPTRIGRAAAAISEA